MADETSPLLNESATAPSAPPQIAPPLYDSALSAGSRSTYGEPGCPCLRNYVPTWPLIKCGIA